MRPPPFLVHDASQEHPTPSVPALSCWDAVMSSVWPPLTASRRAGSDRQRPRHDRMDRCLIPTSTTARAVLQTLADPACGWRKKRTQTFPGMRRLSMCALPSALPGSQEHRVVRVRLCSAAAG